MFFAKFVTMGSLQELGWQKRVRTKSCGDFNFSNSISQRRQSAPSLTLSKALTKSKPVYRDCVSQISQDPYNLIQSLLSPSRKLISQGNVLLQTGVQTQERYLLLFTDLLIITKAKSVMQVKQKACVRVSEMWTASCVDEVCEAHTITERSFVMGWPTYNCVATFSTSEEKERWLSLIESCIKEEKQYDDPQIIPLEIFSKDIENCDHVKTISVSNTDCTSDVISTALKQFGLSGVIKDYQLWVCSKKDETPYPLIGHEFPYSIKISHMRSLQQDAVTSSHRQEALLPMDLYCQFFLRPRQISCTITGEQKGRKRRMSLISWALKRSFSIEQDVHSESPASSGHTMTSSGQLFGQPLSNVIKDNTLPSPVVDMLMCLCSHGAMTPGILRRSAGVKACRELREKLDSGHHERPLNEESVFVTAAVFKDFLRNIPGSLLCEELYELWLRAIEQDGVKERRMMEIKQLQEVQRLLQLLPMENLLLLRHVIAMLHQIQLNAEHNQMNSYNLAVCIAPSCLWNSYLQSQEEDAKKVCDLMHFLIDNCHVLFGTDIITLLKDLTEDSRSKFGSVGSLQQMSDSGYDSLKNEVNTETEDILGAVPLKDSRSMDSLISSDYDLDCPDDELETDSTHPMVQSSNVQHRALELQRDSVTGYALKTHVHEEDLKRGKCDKVEIPAGELNENVLEQRFQQLKLASGKDEAGQQTPPSVFRHNTSDYLKSSLRIFHSPQNFSPKSYWLRRKSADYQYPLTDGTHFERDVLNKSSLSKTKSPPSYQVDLTNLNRKVPETLTQVRATGKPLKEINLLYKGPGNSPSEDHQMFHTRENFKHAGHDSTCMKFKAKEKATLPESMFYGQSRKLTVHRFREENPPINADCKADSHSGKKRTFKGSDALNLKSEKVAEIQAVGRSHRLRRCSSSQWVGELGFHSEESYV
ncbi:rho GTPase-activating protein 20 [Paramisgurnus dabryanus]|uniref:rho GTPase-activating protein 20 n=1 Tax=Paramisgurnus dabryanus TaxID=90735 RepID=UPI0031F39062